MRAARLDRRAARTGDYALALEGALPDMDEPASPTLALARELGEGARRRVKLCEAASLGGFGRVLTYDPAVGGFSEETAFLGEAVLSPADWSELEDVASAETGRAHVYLAKGPDGDIAAAYATMGAARRALGGDPTGRVRRFRLRS